MATAVIHAIRPAGNPLFPSQSAYIASCAFWGDDVGDAIRGQPMDVLIQLPAGYTLGQLKSSLSQAVADQATALGLTITSADIDIPSFEHGPP